MKDDDDIKLSLVYNKKLQKTAEVSILASDKTALLTKDAIGRKKVILSIRKMIYTIS